ncbi:phosphotransferase family protein [Sphingorhabdus sp.]|jgi:aminoglycoside phosphotransferase (APT) family kinase protein|uniref:phosphotransferase family protein n=1 Tax=Sphingorhabdus sp. TaxID=1902408 RepID=UPI0037CB2A9B
MKTAIQPEVAGVINVDRLAVWMREKDYGDDPITSVRLLKGGTQNILLSIEMGRARVVLRRPPINPRPGSDRVILREAQILRALAQTDVPHAKLIALCEDESVIGVPFYVMEEVEGFNATNGLPPLHENDHEMRRQMGFEFIDCIAALGALDHRAIGLGDFGNPDGFLQRQVARWQKQLAGYSDFNGWPGWATPEDVDYVSSYLMANQPDGFSPGILHGDYSLGNVLFSNSSKTINAVLDWELTTIGDPLVDLGHIVATWQGSGGPDLTVLRVEPWHGFPGLEEIIGRYGEQSARDLSNIGWYIVLACYRLAIIIEGTFARSCAGLASKEDGILLHENAVRLLARAMFHIRKRNVF